MNLGLTVITSEELLDGTEYPQVFLNVGGSYMSVQMAELIERKHSCVDDRTADVIGRHLLRDDVALGNNYVREANNFWANH